MRLYYVVPTTLDLAIYDTDLKKVFVVPKSDVAVIFAEKQEAGDFRTMDERRAKLHKAITGIKRKRGRPPAAETKLLDEAIIEGDFLPESKIDEITEPENEDDGESL